MFKYIREKQEMIQYLEPNIKADICFTTYIAWQKVEHKN